MKRPVPRHLVQPSAKRCSMVLYSGAEATGATRTGPVSPLNRLSKLSFSSLVMKVSASPDGSWRSYLTSCPWCQHDVDLDVDNPGRWAYPPGSGGITQYYGNWLAKPAPTPKPPLMLLPV